MSAVIKNIYTCPRCDEGITASSKPDFCPGCGFKLSGNVDSFTVPHTIAEQSERLTNKTEHVQFVLNLSMDAATNIMQDALHIIQTIGGKKVLASDIRNLMGLAIKIGDVAKKYEEFLGAGGSHTPGLFITSGETNELQQAADGSKTTAPVATTLFTPVGKK